MVLQSRWKELDMPLRFSTVFGFVMGPIQLLLAAPMLHWWLVLASSDLAAQIVENPYSILWLVVFAVTLSPFFLVGSTIGLIIKPLSPESRGILGFLTIIAGIFPTILLFFFFGLAVSS